ncbi:MAG: metallo-beta-lactamase [Ignavibacteria bacterium]|nr:MAG: metallo-beta-lactamase [Ignavibacteria bacterium]KAF0160644.1 MAG: metallo-beta-lactamase [Ignavibacteria bacterium]
MLKIQRFVFNLFHVNTFLICDDETKVAAVIDPGMYEEAEKSAFKSFVLNNVLKLNYCINTHCHIDHVLGNSFVKREFGAQLMIPKDDEFLLEMMIEQANKFGLEAEISPKPNLFINETSTLQLGKIEGKFIFTPGHTPGEVCLYFEKEKVLFAGDVLFKESIGRTDLWGGDYETLIRSIKEKLLALPDDVKVYPGHESATTIGYEKLHNPFLVN